MLRAPALVPIDTNVRDAFERFDTDGSGNIDVDELPAALAMLGLTDVSGEKLAYVMRKYDTDRNDTLDLEEVCAAQCFSPFLSFPAHDFIRAQFANMVEDLRVNTTSSMQRRLALRSHPAVVAALERWRSTAWSSMEADLRMAGGAPSVGVQSLELSHSQYVLIVRNVVKSMVEGVDDEDSAQTAEEDWESDRRGHSTLSAELFMDGIFEYATPLQAPPLDCIPTLPPSA